MPNPPGWDDAKPISSQGKGSNEKFVTNIEDMLGRGYVPNQWEAQRFNQIGATMTPKRVWEGTARPAPQEPQAPPTQGAVPPGWNQPTAGAGPQRDLMGEIKQRIIQATPEGTWRRTGAEWLVPGT